MIQGKLQPIGPVAKAVVVKEKTEKIDKQKLKLNVKQDERNKYYNY